MPADREFIAAKVPKKTARLLEEIRKKLQAERPDTVVSRSDALRHCIHSLSADFRMSDLPTSIELEGDENADREEKVTAKGGD